MNLQRLPPEIIYNIFQFLPSADITKLARFHCRPLRYWSLVLLDERAQQSMEDGWRLMLGATVSKLATDQDDNSYEEDKEYVCEYQYIDPYSLNIHFSVRAFGEDGFCSLVDHTPLNDQLMEMVSSATLSPPPEQQQIKQHIDNDSILIPFDTTATTIQVSVLKEKVPTKLLEFATTLPSDYSFQVLADDYHDMEPQRKLYLSAKLQPHFTVQYHIQRLVSYPSIPVPTTHSSSALVEFNFDTTVNSSMVTPDIQLHIDSLQVSPDWWWAQLDRHHHGSFLGLEYIYW
ncbi:uncharacterized protein BX664DRAFT_325556 [Halteromyces radiatus]|uniref:uncharacterized protein n=1 Tax=Halteromyces radiatus TaxID=101107 RepID=UPI0022210BB0|nr:uncharacterized protein BX664DRAFT_325556 [Halteromyces radiatus]KAI8097092.1 hypothetical protein BX664DRAFT_325556 [Halteromyces radiatus]